MSVLPIFGALGTVGLGLLSGKAATTGAEGVQEAARITQEGFGLTRTQIQTKQLIDMQELSRQAQAAVGSVSHIATSGISGAETVATLAADAKTAQHDLRLNTEFQLAQLDMQKRNAIVSLQNQMQSPLFATLTGAFQGFSAGSAVDRGIAGLQTPAQQTQAQQIRQTQVGTAATGAANQQLQSQQIAAQATLLQQQQKRQQLRYFRYIP